MKNYSDYKYSNLSEGTIIYFTGDHISQPGSGLITADIPNKGYIIEMVDGRKFEQVHPSLFEELDGAVSGSFQVVDERTAKADMLEVDRVGTILDMVLVDHIFIDIKFN